MHNAAVCNNKADPAFEIKADNKTDWIQEYHEVYPVHKSEKTDKIHRLWFDGCKVCNDAI